MAGADGMLAGQLYEPKKSRKLNQSFLSDNSDVSGHRLLEI